MNFKMKKWFENIKRKYLIHIILGSILVFSLTFVPQDSSIFTAFSFVWFALLIIEIIFIVWHVQFNKKIKNNNQMNLNQSQNKVANIINKEKIADDNKITFEKNADSLIFIDVANERCFLKYKYIEKLCFIDNLEDFNLGDIVAFRLNTNNEFDKDTVEIIINDKVIGLMYKGNCRDIVIKCIKYNKFIINAQIVKKDLNNSDVRVLMCFYSKITNENSVVTSLIKTSKKDSISGEKRWETLESMSEGDIVCLNDDDFEIDGLVVTDEYGNEVGEVSKAIKNKISQYSNKNFDEVYAYIESIDYDYDKCNAKIRIIY